ncbi:ribbon-helix-helix protein, CopG family [Jiangella sp. DSM 45060]|uniref:ribbon-helix-helix protein, CopG family n=1 Tax=Jiangella sp. DSM 45060 TaxID=1798224 RepID=UPI0008792B7F|nr:ribbon-helix-helix protein, CopG family [Jiangella sp. DSM 45060]SDT63949.1 Ribbon-helix-helix protein, copG family [Jiangella sp. DSM 45060]
MAMTLRLTEEETEILRQQAEREHRSMQEVARLAILERAERSVRDQHVRGLARVVKERHAELLARLAE